MPSGAPKLIDISEGLCKALTFHGGTSQTKGEAPWFVKSIVYFHPPEKKNPVRNHDVVYIYIYDLCIAIKLFIII